MAWNGGTVKALCDVYGRLYVNKQLISGDNYFAGIAWDDNGIVSGFDSDDEAFTQIILTYGCNDAVTSYNETSATVTINDESVVFNFTNGQLVPVTSAWQQGSTPMFFYRTVNDGSSDVTVVCTPDGKLYVGDTDNYIKRVNDGFAWSTGAASQTLITNCGGKVAMDVAAGDDNLMTVISMNDYTVVFTEDGEVTVGTIEQYHALVASVWADENCTVKPTGVLSEVYVKFHRELNQTTVWPTSSDPYYTSDFGCFRDEGAVMLFGKGSFQTPMPGNWPVQQDSVHRLTLRSEHSGDVSGYYREFYTEGVMKDIIE